ncbi:carbonic anhydrase 2 isoform X1 [Hydra vulgaris]|uniref:carbonic anhydrase 2 isoform X1 n=1 Tax=Hydra vulgaris TaxID=6087 RepID=UPI001F5FE560|nr:carbonic anhydrase 2-like [Hydra vulgaris]XP_047138145.1 carbonic anhydrase 2-like [Hydra vulgaris]
MLKETDYAEEKVVSNNNIYWDFSKNHGPKQWLKTWSFTTRQSPIDIVLQNVQYDSNLKALNFDRQFILVHVTNIGWNISFRADNIRAISLYGGALTYNYAFREMHFHWGEVYEGKCELGCEHTIDGKRYAAEFHAVHWNTDLYATESDAIANPDGLAVIGVLIDANESYDDNEEFKVFLEMFEKVPYMNNTASFMVDPYLLLPKNTNHYFTYPGSLTMPPLTENVTWTLFTESIKISIDQLKRMSKSYPKESCNEKCFFKFQRQSDSITITNNYRLTQPLNDRLVKSSYKV